jgi:hypothetical protein
LTARTATVRAHGHPMLRSAHAKTFELTAETAVGPRATCVVGVGATIPDELSWLRGEVRLTLRAGGQTASGTATVNPGHEVSKRLVIRRSESADADTFAVRSTLTAADLPRAMVDALASPDAEVELTVAEAEPAPPLVILGEASGGRLAALAGAADPVNPARPPEIWIGRIFRAPANSGAWTGSHARVWLSEAYAHNARFIVDRDPCSPLAALLSAGLASAPYVWLGRLDRAALKDRATRAAWLESAAPAVAVLAPADAADVVGAVANADPQRQVAMPDGRLDLGSGMVWRAATSAVDTPWPAHDAPIVVAPIAEAGTVNVAALTQALRTAGVPARTVAEALGPLGWDRRAIYRMLGPGGDAA